MNKTNVAIVRGYLQDHFPDGAITENEDGTLTAQAFRVELPNGSRLLKVAENLLDDKTPEQVSSLLNNLDVASALRGESKRSLFLTSIPPRIEWF